MLGWPRRQLESAALLVVASVAGAGLAWLVIWAVPEPQAVTLSSQELLARTEPRLLDLGVAVAAGAAGAYILARREAVSALPGVAIAVALVPPLASVGMLLELGRPELALNALLLYVTNLAGIVLAAGVTLIVTGVLPRSEQEGLPRRVKLGLGVALLAVLLVAVPLASFSRQVILEAVDQDDADRAARAWARPAGLQVEGVDVDDSRVEVDVAGPRTPPPVEPLARRLAGELE